MSSPKRKVKTAVNQQIKAGLNAVRDFLAGRSNDEKVAAPQDKETREVVVAELLATMSGRTKDDASSENPKKEPDVTQEIPRFNSGEAGYDTTEENPNHQASQSDSTGSSITPEHSENPSEQEQERARQLFLDHGYFDETVQNLRGASSPIERAAAARALGLVGSQRATAHLVAAMFDDDEEVRSAAEEALSQIGDPASGNVAVAAEVEKVDDEASTASAVKEREDLEEPETKLGSHSVFPETVEVAADAVAGEQTENPDLISTDSVMTAEEDELLREEQTIREALAGIEQQLLEATTAFKKSESEVYWRTEREGKLRADAAALRLEEEKLRKRAEDEAEVRRATEQEAVTTEQAARVKAEVEAQRYADEESKLRLKAASLRLDVADIARRLTDLETARSEAIEAEHHAEAMRARNDARSRHEVESARLRGEEEDLQRATDEVLLQQANVSMARDKAASEIEQLKEELLAVEKAQRTEAERLRREGENRNSEAQEQLRMQLEGLRQDGEEVARRRAEVEAAREQADADAQRLLEAQARMQAAQEARAQAEIERSQLEAEINQQVEKQLQLLEETRRRGETEQERLREQLRLRTETEQQRLAEMELLKTKAEIESKERAEREQQILGQIDSLRIADAETRRRIADAEVKRRAADDAYRLIAEKVQRVETEAHARAMEEERMLQKLESERRNAAIEAQSRSEQQNRIREEIEIFRRLEEEERPRIEEGTLQLAEAEARLQQSKDRLREGAEARATAEEELMTVGDLQRTSARQSGAIAPQQSAQEKPASILPDPSFGVATEARDQAASVVNPAIATYLNSVDPYKRAAAVTELARSGTPDAFMRIAECFDDHSPHVRNAAARALRKLEPGRTVDLFNRALEQASDQRRRNIGAAIAASGLATDAINNLAGENREETYNALSILFVMAKTGEVEPLVRAVKEHRDDEIGKAVSKLLTLSGHQAGR